MVSSSPGGSGGWAPGSSTSQGNGTGGPGIGNGFPGEAPGEDLPMEATRLDSQIGAGIPAARWYRQGDAPLGGEARAEVEREFRRIGRQMEDAFIEDGTPAPFRSLVRRYNDALRRGALGDSDGDD